MTITSPKELKRALDEYVVGQEHAKEVIAIACATAQLKEKTYLYNLREITSQLLKQHCLMIGSTGCGKSYLVRKAAELCDLPFLYIDASSLTKAGYVGLDINDHLISYVQKCKDNREDPRFGIIFIDEFDKLKTEGDEFATKIQGSLLPLLDGQPMRLERGVKTPTPTMTGVVWHETDELETKNLTVILAGSFQSLREERDAKKKSPGFTALDVVKQKIKRADLAKAGIMTELLARVAQIVELDKLTKDDLMKILTIPKSPVLKPFYETLELTDKGKIELTDAELNEIVDNCDPELGGRGLSEAAAKLWHHKLMDMTFSRQNRLIETKRNERVNLSTATYTGWK